MQRSNSPKLNFSSQPVANAAGVAAFHVTPPKAHGKGGFPVGYTDWWNLATNEAGTHADIYLYGVVGGWDGMDSRDVVNELRQYNNLQTITLHINSVGGSIVEGLGILNTIRKHPASVTTEIDGFALSIASIAAFAADKGRVRMARNAFMMIHNASAGCWGTARDMKKSANMLEKLERGLISEYVARMGGTEQEVQAMLDEETWFTAEEALAAGLIDEIISPVDLDEASNHLGVETWQNMQASGLQNMPEQVTAQMNRVLNLTPANLRNSAPSANGAGTPAGSQTNSSQGNGGEGAAGAQASGHSPAPQNNSQPTQPAAQQGGGAAAGQGNNPSAAPDLTAAQAQWREQEQTRRTDITNLFTPFGGVGGTYAELATNLLNDMGCTVENARAQLLNHIGQQSPGPVSNGGSVQITEDEGDKRIAAAVNSLLARGGQADLEQGNPMAYMSLQDMAYDSLNRAGVTTRGQHPLNMVGQAFMMQTTSDFPVILERTITEAVLIAYRKKSRTWQRWCKIGSVSDFRDHDRLRLGSFGNLDALTEAGEFKNKSIPDGEKEKVRVATKGNIIAVTREAIINDDLGYFMGMSTMLGDGAGRTVEADAYTHLLSNPKLADGKPVFHASHNNLMTGAAMSEDSLDGARQLMNGHKDISGNDELDIDPALLMVNNSMRLTADRWMKSATLPGQDNSALMNAVNGMAEVLATSRLKSINKGFYLFADPGDAPVIEVNFLYGNQEPFIDTQDGWRVDGTEMKVRLDFGVGAVDYRGAVFNPGAA